MNTLNIRPADDCRYDIVSLGEVMLRLDPGEGRIRRPQVRILPGLP
jgi:2-dehydro-3-deoxygluconokinase